MIQARSLHMAAAMRAGSRSLSSAALTVDWALIRSKMGSPAGKAAVDSAREAFERRVAAALAAPAPKDIDWAEASRALPDIDIAALRKDFERAVAATPALAYDGAADSAAHASAEAGWAGFEAYCKGRVAQLQALQAEQSAHKLHRWYRRARVWQRFPGLYESIHHRVRGTWESALWAQYIEYKARAVPLPWNEAAIGGETDKTALLKEIKEKSGLSDKQVGSIA